MGLPPFMAVAHQPGLSEDPEVLRDRRLRDAGLDRQSPHRLLALTAQPLEQRPPGRIGQRFE
jgi:hypothetical protein